MSINEHSLPESRRYYKTVIPNLYDDAGLTVYEFRLLVHYARVVVCQESIRTSARKCRMSKGMVTRARESLIEKGFIEVERNDNHPWTVWVIDLWDENYLYYSQGDHLKKTWTNRSQGGQAVHGVDIRVHAVNDVSTR